MHRRHLHNDLVQRQTALDDQPVPQPAVEGRQLALRMVALRQRQKPPAFALQDHHVVHKTRRYPKVPRRLTMPMTLLNESDHPAA